MQVVVPNLLIARRLIVLAHRSAIASIRLLQRYRDLLGGIEYCMAKFFRHIVDIFNVTIWNDDYMAFVLSPPFARYKRSHVARSQHDIGLLITAVGRLPLGD